jgi:hypothetical protein
MSVVPIRVQTSFSGSKEWTIEMNEWKELLRPVWAQEDRGRTSVTIQDLIVFAIFEKSVA